MRLNQNMESLSVLRNYSKSLKIQNTASERISSGSKINSAKDNPNKIAMKQGLRLQLRSLQMSERNLQDGISLMQTSDSIVANVNESLIRMKELVVQAASFNNEDDRAVVQREIDQLIESIDQTVNNGEFNGVNILNRDDKTPLPHMVGINSGENMDIPVFNITTSNLVDEDGNSIKNLDVVNGNVDVALSLVDKSISTVTAVRSKFGSIQNRMETTMENSGEIALNIEKAESRVGDADIALEMAELARGSILTETSLALLQQTNNFPKDVLNILQGMR